MGYVHDTHMSQFIPCTALHYVTGTWTQAAGQVADTIAMHKAAGAETAVVNIPVTIPSNSVALKGAKLASVELDYECIGAAATSVTAVVYKITRGADGAVAVAASQTSTQDLTAATDAADQDQHKLTVTITTPFWLDNDVYVLVEVSFICGGVITVDVLGAVANFTLRI